MDGMGNALRIHTHPYKSDFSGSNLIPRVGFNHQTFQVPKMEESSPEAVWIRLISKGKNLQNPQKIAFYFDSFFRFKIAAYFEVSPKLLVKSKSHEIA